MFLQLRRLNEEVARQLHPLASWQDMAELEAQGDALIARLRCERSSLARERDRLTRLREVLDRRLRTDAPEYLDRPDYPANKKVRIVRGLHVMNAAFRAYDDFLGIVTPALEEAGRRHGRTPRLLELASGSGEFTLALAKKAKERNLDVEVIGSDIVPEHVDQGLARARERNIRADFRVLNAFDLESRCAPGSFDVVFIAQSMHHFTPGQLAMMIAQAAKVATTAFIGIDGYRSLRLLALIPSVCMLGIWPGFVHDGFISARKFYSDAELRLLAELAAPGADLRLEHKSGRFSVLKLGFGGGLSGSN